MATDLLRSPRMTTDPRGQDRHTRVSARLVLLAIALHAALTASLALARYTSVHNRTFDLALYARMAWGVVHAEPWDPIVGGNFLGGHIPLVLVPLGLLGALFGTVPVLLLAQSTAVALTAWPISLIGVRCFGPAGGVVAALAFLLYPNLGHVATYEFHPGTLALLPLGWALEVLDRPAASTSARALASTCMLALACRVSLGLQTIWIGVLAWFRAPALRRVGLGIAFGSLAYFALSMFWLQPVFGAASTRSTDLHYGHLGGSPLGLLPTLIAAPGKVADHLLAPERRDYLLRVLLPLALLPLAAPRYLLIALPPLALNLLSQFPTASTLYSHYLTPAVPALIVAAVRGLRALMARIARLPAENRQGAEDANLPGSTGFPWRLATAWRFASPIGLATLLLASAVGSVIAGGLPWSRDFAAAEFRGDRVTGVRRAAIARVGSSASVQAPDALLPHLSERRSVHRAPPPDRGTEFVVLDVSHRRRFAGNGSLLRTVEEPIARAWLARPDRRVVFAQEDLLILRRGLSPRGGLVRRYFAGVAPPDSGRSLCSCLAVREAELHERRLQIELVARATCPTDLAIRFGPDATPTRVDLLFDGLLSPAHLSRGDLLHSTHVLSAAERAAIVQHGLHVGALRSSGARPRPHDPISLPVRLRLR